MLNLDDTKGCDVKRIGRGVNRTLVGKNYLIKIKTDMGVIPPVEYCTSSRPLLQQILDKTSRTPSPRF